MAVEGRRRSRRAFLRTGTTGALAAWQLGRNRDAVGRDGAVAPPHESTLRAETIADVVRARWALHVRRCDLFHNGINHTYRVDTDRGRFWFRLTRRAHRCREHIEGEVAMLRHFVSQQLPVVVAVPDREGRHVARVAAPEGPRCGVLFEDVGVPWEPRFDPRRAGAIGRIMADMHIAADTVAEVPRMRIDFDAMFGRLPRVLAQYLADDPGLLEDVRRLCGALGDYVRPLLPRDGGWGFCHGDLHLANVFFDEQERPIVIDFDHAFNGYRGLDLAIHLCSIGPAAMYDAVGRSVRRSWWKSFFAGYEQRVAVGPDFRRLVEALIPTRMLLFTCYMIEAIDSWGAWIVEPFRIRRVLYMTRLWARELRIPLPKRSDEPSDDSILAAAAMHPSPFVLPGPYARFRPFDGGRPSR